MKKKNGLALLLCIVTLLAACISGCGQSDAPQTSENEIKLIIQLDVKEAIGLLIINHDIDGNEGTGGISNADKSMIRRNDVLDWTFDKQFYSDSADTVDLTLRFRVITEYCDPNQENIYPEEYTMLLDPVSFKADFGETYHITITGDKINGYQAITDTPSVSENKMTILDNEGNHLGAIDSRANCTAVDRGIFYSIFELGEYQFTADTEYRCFDKENKQDVYLGTLEDQGYEAAYARTEYGGQIYTLAVTGNPMSDTPVPLILLAFDPAAGTMKKHIVSETGFPYACMAVSNGKLLIMNHEMTEPKCDRIYEYDPAAETIKEVLTFSSDTDSLRGVCPAENGFFLLRLKLKNDGENELYLDRYDNSYGKVSEESLSGMLIKAVMENPGIIDRQDALNELGMNVSRFIVQDERYLIYENFGMTRLIIDMQTGEAILVRDDIYSVSLGSGTPFFYRMDFDAEDAEEPDITGLIDGKLLKLDFKPADSHKLIRQVSHSADGTWLIISSDGYSMQDSTFVLHLWTESES